MGEAGAHPLTGGDQWGQAFTSAGGSFLEISFPEGQGLAPLLEGFHDNSPARRLAQTRLKHSLQFAAALNVITAICLLTQMD